MAEQQRRKGTDGTSDTDTLTAKILECPICYEPLQPPIHQCYNGHLICQTCVENVKKCPVCREDMPLKLIRNRAVEELTKDHEYECKETGCPIKLRRADFEFHKLYECQYVSLPFCKLLGIPTCKAVITRGEICQHMSTTHGIPVLKNEKAQVHYLCVKSEDQLEQNGSKMISWRPCIFQCFNQTFFLKCELNAMTHSLSWTPLCHSRDEVVTNNIRITLTLEITSSGSQGTTIEWKGGPHSLFDDTATALVLPMKHCGFLFRSDDSNKGTLILSAAFEFITEVESVSESDMNLVKVESTPVFSDTEIVRANLIHWGVRCNVCSRKDIPGVRLKCLECADYDLCEHCERTSNAHDHHVFARLAFAHSGIRMKDILSRCPEYKRRNR